MEQQLTHLESSKMDLFVLSCAVWRFVVLLSLEQARTNEIEFVPYKEGLADCSCEPRVRV